MIDPQSHPSSGAHPNPEWDKIKNLFAAANRLPAAERAAFLDQECAGDPKLRAEIESLLKAQPANFSITDSTPLTERIGTKIGPYKLLEKIGEGGFGVVFMAEQEKPVRRKVALKIIKLGMDTRQVVARFEQERQALAMMDHPNIAKVFDGGATESGRPYFVMELVRGIAITDYCDQERLRTKERLALFNDVCRAVQHAHQKGIIHRDIKPGNVLVTLVDGKPVPKVIDFGVAKAAHAPLTDKTLFTGFQQVMGTPLYMSPEQTGISGVDVDTRSDIYSLGVLLYELLTGTTPLTREQIAQAGLSEIQRLIREVDPPKPSTRLETLGKKLTTVANQRRVESTKLGILIRGDLDWIVMKCLDKDRVRRYETPVGLAQDVERHLNGEAVLAAPPSAGYRMRKYVKRHRSVVVSVSLVFVSLVAGLSASLYLYKEATNAESEKSTALNDAQEKKALAERKTEDAKKAEEKWEFEAYVANIQAADAALRVNEVATARRRLDACPEKLRNWEWRYLNAESDTSIATFECLSAIGSPDRKYIIMSKGNNALDVRNATSGDLIVTLYYEHKPEETKILFSVDGSMVFAIPRDNRINVWETTTWTPIAQTQLPGPQVDFIDTPAWQRAFASTVNGQRVIISCGRNELHIQEIDSGKIIAVQLDGDLRTGSSMDSQDSRIVAISRDGRQIAGLSSIDGCIRVWGLLSGRTIALLRIEDSIWDCGEFAFNPNGKSVAVAISEDAVDTVRLIDIDTGKVVCKMPGYDFAFSPDGTRIAITCNSEFPIIIYDSATGDKTAILGGQEKGNGIRSIEFSANGTQIAAACDDGSVRIWNAASAEEYTVLCGHSSSATNVIFNHDGTSIVTASLVDGTAKLWDASRRICLGPYVHYPFKEESARVHAQLFDATSISGGFRVVTMGNCPPHVTEASVAADTAVLRPSEGIVKAVNYNASRAVVEHYDNKNSCLQIWDVVTNRYGVVLTEGTREMHHIAFSPDGTRIIACDKLALYVWDSVTGTKLMAISSSEGTHFNSARLSYDGTRVVTAASDNTVRIWNTETGKELIALRGHDGEVRSAEFSRDGSRVVTVSDDWTVRLWDSMSESAIAVLQHEDCPVQATLSPDCTRIYTTSWGGKTVRVWDVFSKRELLMLRGHTQPVESVSLSADGKQVITAGLDGIARVWDSTPYRERFPRIQMTRDSIRKLRPRIEKDVALGKSLESINDRILADSFLSELDQTAASIVLCEYREKQHEEETTREITASRINSLAWRVVRMATVMQTSEAINKALADATRAVELAPKNAGYQETLGAALYRAGRFEEALSRLVLVAKEYAVTQEEDPCVWAFISMSHAKLNRKDQAQSALEKLRQLAQLDEWSSDEDVKRFLAEAQSTLSECFPDKR